MPRCRHRRAERRQGRVRREAAHAERSKKGPQIVKAARVNERICQVGMQQRSGKHYLRGEARVLRHRQAGQDHARPHLVARQQLSSAQGSGVAADAALESGLGAFPGAAEVARLRSAAVLQLARLSRFRRRPGDGPVHALDRRGAHVHGAGHSDSRRRPRAASIHYKDGRTAPDTINVLLEYPADFTATFEATLAPGITGAAVEMCGTKGGL